jgi:hypothetical protein
MKRIWAGSNSQESGSKHRFRVTQTFKAASLEFTVQRELTCHTCGTPLLLMRTGGPNYRWQCPKNCLPAIDTGVPTDEPIDQLQPDESGTVEFNASHFVPPLTGRRISTAKVFMAQILYHFIECTRGGCYNSLYFSVLVPHLDCPEIVDYVLRSSVVQGGIGVSVGKTGAKLYPELRARLQSVASSRIHKYLAVNFSSSV